MTERIPRWAWASLALILIFDVWWRCHTIAPTIRDAWGVAPWPVVAGEAEPLDCDEAAYGYIGREIAEGAVMYRDLSENKPPLGYWLYALAAAVGGAEETPIRLMPIPYVLATIALVWRIGVRIGGPWAGALTAWLFAILSTDPFLYGNGANMEHFFNLFSVAALGSVVLALDRPAARWPIALAGACLGAAVLVKQVAAAQGPVYLLALLLAGPRPGWRAKLRDAAALALGFGAVVGAAVLVVVLQGAGASAFEDIIRYGSALATLKVRDPSQPSGWVRWLTGNADPDGKLPWPWTWVNGRTDYLVWWGTGSWPAWLAAAPALPWMLLGKGSTPARRLVAAWTVAAGVETVAPGLYWQHYYLLPTPGLALIVAVAAVDAIRAAVRTGPPAGKIMPGLVAVFLLAAIGWTARIQVREYLMVEPEELTARDKGGRQWIALRGLGRELARRTEGWPSPTLYVWGWQSPLFLYSGLDGVTRQFFADPLLEDYARGHHRDHPAVRPRVERIMADLRKTPPSLVLVANQPFPELKAFLDDGYIRSSLGMRTPDGRGLWVERSRYAAFEAARPQPAATATGSGNRPAAAR
ncbi:glycosyltransferase family 39 protein [Tundrisphaera sp. TA3]|uniref:ArnT family glycosyltransferase n=1 Tax=Tundrisphaera sp. TA3 TaxID=3435775 RepID=UPI003EBAF7AB